MNTDRAISLFRDLNAERLCTPAPSGLSVDEANALVAAGLARYGDAIGKQRWVILTVSGVEARDTEPGT